MIQVTDFENSLPMTYSTASGSGEPETREMVGLCRAVDGLFDGCVKEDLTSMSFRFLFLQKERRGGTGKTGLILGYSESIFL